MVIDSFNRIAARRELPAGEMLAHEGMQCTHFFVVTRGRLRVYKTGASGREVTLYHVHPYESCVLTAFCALSNSRLPVFAEVAEDLEMLVVPSDQVREWVNRFDVWRDYMFRTVTLRLDNIMETLEQMAFQRLDARIGGFLLRRADQHGDIAITHQALADELGASRVAVSRILEDLANRGLLELSRGQIRLAKPGELAKIVKNSGLR